ncbi:hypothetical protein Bxe_B1408 [Paraburkholderia xenovorans LB400]|uniref:Uncharacterized protein n=1 Tax=Paraburkholderia xenovorans (strain LB400) TaxID=266265 RepID=Q13MY3_PARXL|nr:hypothetical protein Bxe_B1408 [Paraburkholderia xenovorans LB400]
MAAFRGKPPSTNERVYFDRLRRLANQKRDLTICRVAMLDAPRFTRCVCRRPDMTASRNWTHFLDNPSSARRLIPCRMLRRLEFPEH